MFSSGLFIFVNVKKGINTCYKRMIFIRARKKHKLKKFIYSLCFFLLKCYVSNITFCLCLWSNFIFYSQYRFNNRNREFRKGMDGEERRRAREDDRYRLRKQDREIRLQKRRAIRSQRQNMNNVQTNILTNISDGCENLHKQIIDPFIESMVGVKSIFY